MVLPVVSSGKGEKHHLPREYLWVPIGPLRDHSGRSAEPELLQTHRPWIHLSRMHAYV